MDGQMDSRVGKHMKDGLISWWMIGSTDGHDLRMLWALHVCVATYMARVAEAPVFLIKSLISGRCMLTLNICRHLCEMPRWHLNDHVL